MAGKKKLTKAQKKAGLKKITDTMGKAADKVEKRRKAAAKKRKKK